MAEKLINFVFIYIIIWWILIFCVLPFGIEIDDNRVNTPANDSGAPKNPKLKKKFIITSILAFIVTISWMIANYYFDIV